MAKVEVLHHKSKTFRSFAEKAAVDDRAKSGLVIWFEEDGTMHFGQFGITLSQVGMAQMYIQMLAVQMMEAED